jgi:hypothetical protein
MHPPDDLEVHYRAEDGALGYVCSECIGEIHLHAEIERWGRERLCTGCKETRPKCVALVDLALRVDVVYRQLVNRAEYIDYPSETGTSPVELFLNLTTCNVQEIGDAMVRFLADHHADAIVRDGEPNWYEADSEDFTLRVPYNPAIRGSWLRFKESLKHTARFFNRDATDLLDRILGPVLRDERSVFKGAIRTIGPEDADRYVFRGRVANDEGSRAVIYASPKRQLGPPQPAIATAGRMNPAGVRVFYGSRDALTCVAELRAPVGGSAVVGRFEIMRPLRLLDLTVLEKIKNTLSYFDPMFMEVHDVISFVPGFHKDIRKPVIPGQEALEYVPTQVVAEYLWTREDHAVDGLIFSSSQVSGDRTNLVLFPQACVVEGARAEKSRKVSRSFEVTHHDEKLPEEDIIALLPVSGGTANAGPSTEEASTGDSFSETAQPEPALRLDEGTLARVTVRAIDYHVVEARVRIEDDGPDAF